MDGDEKVSVFFVGDLRSSEKRDESVATACVYDVDARAVLLDIVSGFFSDAQRDVFFLRFFSDSARVFPTMASINDDGSYFSLFLSLNIQVFVSLAFVFS